MAADWLAVPDWFSFDNQGAAIAVADVTGNGRLDLIVLMVDNGAQQNQGVYRVGRDLDDHGQVTGGWGPWIQVPDWFSWENQGAGIAVADVSGNGRLDLVVLMVDNPVGQNQGLYRVGRDLDATGAVTGGWSDFSGAGHGGAAAWTPVPDWFSFENQGAGIAVADVSGNGHLDLVVLMVDNPVGQNQGLYRVGRDLDGTGAVTGGWSDFSGAGHGGAAAWTPVPDWFSFENQGAGIAVADVTGNGHLDLVVLMVDNPVGQNQGLYRIARDVDAAGTPTNGWSSWLGVPNWFSFENQYAGIAIATLGGIQDLLVFMVDNPLGQNAGLYSVIGLDHDPRLEGTWEVQKFNSEVLAVHAAVLNTGKVLFYAGSGNSRVRFQDDHFGDTTRGFWTSVVWDPTVIPANGDTNFFHPDTLFGPDNRPVDFFCGGESFLADGTLLSAGGTLLYDKEGKGHHGFHGRPDAATFDPGAAQWTQAASMKHGRWYPTLVTLADGRVLATSGLDENGVDKDAQRNKSLEVYTPRQARRRDSWRPLRTPAGFPGLPLYAHLFLLEDGRIVFTGGRMDDPTQPPDPPGVLDIAANPVSLTPLRGLSFPDTRNQSASVLLPPAQDQRVMIVGGGPASETSTDNAVNSADIADLKAADPSFQAAAPMDLARMHLNAVLLPDHTVFVSGGALRHETDAGIDAQAGIARLQAEIYDPTTNTWRLVAAATVARMYHSIALLLPDATVVTAGGNPGKGDHVDWRQPDKHEELRLEIYKPPYLFRGPRPVIGQVDTEWRHGATNTITTPQAASIHWASLVKSGVTTHSFNTGQRLVDLDIGTRGPDSLEATLTANPNIAPPGWYLLFLVDRAGVPSVAEWVHVPEK